METLPDKDGTLTDRLITQTNTLPHEYGTDTDGYESNNYDNCTKYHMFIVLLLLLLLCYITFYNCFTLMIYCIRYIIYT